MDNDDLHPPKREKQFNFNSLIGIIALAVIMWVGNKTMTSSDALIEIKTTMPGIQESVKDIRVSIATLVTRAEMESRLNEFSAKSEVFNSRLLKLEYEKRKPE